MKKNYRHPFKETALEKNLKAHEEKYKTSVFISHPGLQHSHQLALALHEQGILQEFYSGVPIIAKDSETPFWMPEKYAKKIKKVDIPVNLRKHPVIFQALLRAGKLLPSTYSKSDWNHRIFHAFDWWTSKRIIKLKPKVVVAYENSAYYTFRAAKTIGAKCILDAPAFHHATAADLNKEKITPYLSEINRRKDEEVELADLILTCSKIAAESYIQAGVPLQKIQAILLGATPPSTHAPQPWLPHNRPLKFIFAGALRKLKSIDLILEAFTKLHREGFSFQIEFIGGQTESGWIDKISLLPEANYIPAVDQSTLFQIMSNADCLLLPSRYDSFGMVVAEAMAVGTPAIVSSHTGAKEIIEKFPKAGWIIEPTSESLYECLKNRITDRETLFLARQAAKEASRYFTWEAYRQRIGNIITNQIT